MCGILGILGTAAVSPLLMEGLKRLEYRGYDSAGLATLDGGQLHRRRATGKLHFLQQKVKDTPIPGVVGIGHTRWATHGVASENNAHPHMTDHLAIVHNGIIENYQTLRAELQAMGREFLSETDTETVAHLIAQYLTEGATPEQAVAKALPRIKGAFAFVIIFKDYDDLMIGARRGSPLAVGYGDGEMYFGSDAMALAHLTQKITYLEEGDWAVISREKVDIFDQNGDKVERPVVKTAFSGAMVGKGNYHHFMQKEIHEQPTVIGDTLATMLNPARQTVTLPAMSIDLAHSDQISISACGTALYAGMIGKYWIETLARVPVALDFASELRYRTPPLTPNGLAMFISQSGETMDTLEALRYCQGQGQRIISIVNVPESSIYRASDAVLLTRAGPEIGVASTKAFTTQLVTLVCFAIALARKRKQLTLAEEQSLVAALLEIPAKTAEILNMTKEITAISHRLSEARDVLYLGRGTSYPLAMEGALKLKEISYIHAEGYAAGEMKHGPIALIDENVPVIVIAPQDALFDKTLANTQETIARGGRVIFLSDQAGIDALKAQANPQVNPKANPITTIPLPKVHPILAPILYALPIQLLAYHTAVIKGTDVDQPRNLAKSVTVE